MYLLISNVSQRPSQIHQRHGALTPQYHDMGRNRYYLEHRTNYWGTEIDARPSDKELGDLPVIWVQLCDRFQGCCPGFGERCVHIRNKHFGSARYTVYLVSEKEGRTPDHYFCKFVAIPEGKHGWGKRNCLDLGWSVVGKIEGDKARGDLKQLLWPYKEDSDYEVTHLHVGLAIDLIETR